MESISDGTLDPQRWNVTFLGGNADLDEPLAPTQAIAASAAGSGAQLPLAMASVGDRLWVARVAGGHRMVRRLLDVGIVEGREITVVSRTDSGSAIVALQGCRIGLGAGLAHRVIVTKTQLSVRPSVPPPAAAQPAAPPQTHSSLSTQPASEDVTMPAPPATLGTLAIGQSGRIVGYEKGGRAYREKLLSMGLTPGTHFTVTRQAPMGDPVEIQVRGFKLSLRKGEAAALHIEPVAPEEVGHD